MTMSVKMLNDIAIHAEGLASEAVAMAEALRAVVDDCAAQVAANRSPDNPTGKTDPEWLEDAQKNIVPPEAEPGKKLTIAEVRAYVAERTKPENRAQIKAILKGFGVSKLTELPEGKYGQLMDEVSKLGRR